MKKEKIKTASALSPLQKRAAESFGRDVMVLAGAGSGKTRVLVERFFHAVTHEHMEPERILAITFTEKAANQMRERLVRQCDEHGLSELRARIEAAAIGTLHSFCGRLLREHPIEAGLDPFFRVMNEGESEIMMDKELDALLEEEADSGEWCALLSDYGEKEMRGSLKRYYRFIRSFGRPPLVFALTELSAQRSATEERLRRHTEAILKVLQKNDLTGSELLLKNAATDLLKALSSPKNGWEAIDALKDAAEGLHRKLPKLKEDVDIILECLEKFTAFIAEELSRPLKTEFVRVYRRFEERVERVKREQAVCDFDDLLYRAHKLLSGGSPHQKRVRAYYREKFQAIFVDEFQDTSVLEAELLRLIKNEGNLFVVGDKQQSIYGFRYAAPEVLENFEKEMSADCAKFALAENYRSRPELLSFVNGFFKKIMDASSFMPLEAKGSFSSKNGPFVERLAIKIDKESVKNIEEARILEASALAQRVSELVESGRFRYRDIAVLFRSTTASYLYEKAFLRAGIPFYAVKGKGFYEKKEVMDVLQFLSVVERSEEDIALAAVLRSPLVGISDDALFWLARTVKSGESADPLFKAVERAEEIKEISESDKQKLKDFLNFRESLTLLKDSVSVQQLIREVISRTHYDAVVLASADGLQRAANLRKLLDMAQSMSRMRSVGIRDFIHFVEAVSERDALEPEARVDGKNRDVVTLSTVHAAKGLEFPCVVIADMGSKRNPNQRAAWRFSRKQGMGLVLKHTISGESLRDISCLKCDEEEDARESAESRRLLYVAMTRAEEHLILSGALTESEKGEATWMRLVSESELPADIQEKQKAVKTKAAPVGELVFPSASEIQTRLYPEAHDYEEMPGFTVTALAALNMPAQEAAVFLQDEPESALFSEDDEPQVSPKHFGVVFHKCLEWLARSKSERIAKSFFDNALLTGLPEKEKKEIELAVREFWEGEWGKSLRSARRVYPELPFIYKTPQGLLKGQIDLVFQDKEGQWIVLDYKTGEFHDYRFQLELYALIFFKLTGEIPQRGVLYYSKAAKTQEFIYTAESLKKFEASLNRLLFERPFDTMKKGGSLWPR